MEKINRSWLTGLDVLRFPLAMVIIIFHFPHFDNIHFNTIEYAAFDFRATDTIDPVLARNLAFMN